MDLWYLWLLDWITVCGWHTYTKEIFSQWLQDLAGTDGQASCGFNTLSALKYSSVLGLSLLLVLMARSQLIGKVGNIKSGEGAHKRLKIAVQHFLGSVVSGYCLFLIFITLWAFLSVLFQLVICFKVYFFMVARSLYKIMLWNKIEFCWYWYWCLLVLKKSIFMFLILFLCEFRLYGREIWLVGERCFGSQFYYWLENWFRLLISSMSTYLCLSIEVYWVTVLLLLLWYLVRSYYKIINWNKTCCLAPWCWCCYSLVSRFYIEVISCLDFTMAVFEVITSTWYQGLFFVKVT